MGWLSGWAKRVKLTVDHNDINSALSDFPILLYISASSGRNNDDISFVFDELQSDANRKKIAVTKSDGTTECYVEIEKWDDANEKAWLWVKAPNISNTADSHFYLYYDSSHADNTTYVGDPNSTPAENVWNTNFKGIWHLGESSGSAIDSTGNNNDGTFQGNLPTQIDGKIAKAQDNEKSTDDYIDIGNLGGAVTGVSAFTVSAWIKLESFPSNDTWQQDHGIVDIDKDAIGLSARGPQATGYWHGEFYGSDDNWHEINSSTNYEIAVWHRISLIFSKPTLKLRLDGSQLTSGSFDFNNKARATGGRIAGRIDTPASRHFDGIIDEVRISATDRSDAWEKASYESERDDLLDWGSQEAPGLKPRSFGFIIG